MVTDEQKAELKRLAQEWEARARQVSEASEEYIAIGELLGYLEEESRG